MMNIGVDIEELKRFNGIMNKSNFLNLIFTKDEIENISKENKPEEAVAKSFCIKEAIVKASNKKWNMREIEVKYTENGIQVHVDGEDKKDIVTDVTCGKEEVFAIALIK